MNVALLPSVHHTGRKESHTPWSTHRQVKEKMEAATMSAQAYRAAKEAFHADNGGSSIMSINAISLAALVRSSLAESQVVLGDHSC